VLAWSSLCSGVACEHDLMCLHTHVSCFSCRTSGEAYLRQRSVLTRTSRSCSPLAASDLRTDLVRLRVQALCRAVILFVGGVAIFRNLEDNFKL
jgi:hypothetical protein